MHLRGGGGRDARGTDAIYAAVVVAVVVVVVENMTITGIRKLTPNLILIFC